MRMHFFRILTFGAVLTAAVHANAQVTISAPIEFENVFYTYNYSGMLTVVGQSINTPDSINRQLSSFTLFTSDSNAIGASSPGSFNAYVYEWSGAGLAGPALYTSSLESTAGPKNVTKSYVFNPDNLVLDSTKTYLIFYALAPSISAANVNLWNDVNNETSGRGWFGMSFDQSIESLSWSTVSSYADLSFSATFSAVAPIPEPATTTALLGTAAIGCIAVRRWQQKRKSSAA